MTVSTHPTNSFGPTTHAKKIPTAQQDPNRPDQTPSKNAMSTPSNEEGGTDQKKDTPNPAMRGGVRKTDCRCDERLRARGDPGIYSESTRLCLL